jgi:type II secretory pathway component PulK
MSRSGQRTERGFALAAILWLLAGLTILIASVSTSMLAVSRTNHDTQERLRLLLAQQRAVANVAYLVLTYKTLGADVQVGSKLLKLDSSTRYQLGEGAMLVLQDMQGLVGLNSPGADDVKRLLVLCGATPQQVDVLSDTLLDYIDADSLKRLNGAEPFEYSAAGLRAPRNQPLLDVRELWQVFGWSQIKPEWTRRACDDWVSLAPDSLLNLWSAPAPVLQAAGLSADQAAAAVLDRDQNREQALLSPYLLTYRSLNEMGGLGGTRFAVRSRGQVRLTVMLEADGLARRLVLERGKHNLLAPFVLSQFEWLPNPSIRADGSPVGTTDRFADNLASFFTLAPGQSNASDAQLPLLPFVKP